MIDFNIIGEALSRPGASLTYELGRLLAERFPDAAVLEGQGGLFSLDDAARAGLFSLSVSPVVHHQRLAWYDSDEGVKYGTKNGWFHVEWRGHPIQVVVLGVECARYFWILAPTRFLAERFLAEICSWNTEVRDEVLVYDDGYWQKDASLLRAIEGVTFDTLILKGELKAELRADVDRFFAGRATYERFGIPWKRGLVLIGPPGNGKTHALKALVNATGKPCLYVKSFACTNQTEHESIREVFERARESAPCLLVFEDLDSLINDKNRAVFLNELDGFAQNTGILAIATTNHPEKLDPAILDRPSRFDRKFHFDLPGPEERRAFLARWNATLDPALRLDEAEVDASVEATEGFSFAYLKELFVSSMVAWFDERDRSRLGAVVAATAPKLRSEMASKPPTPADDQ